MNINPINIVRKVSDVLRERRAEQAAAAASGGRQKPTLVQSLTGAFANSATLTANIEAIQAEVATLKTSLATVTKERNEILGQLATVKAQRAELIRTKSNVAETIAVLGFPSDKLPLHIDAYGEDNPDVIFATWKGLTGGAKTTYYRQHAAVLDSYGSAAS